MNSWLVFQLAVDVGLFALLAIVIRQLGRTRSDDVEAMRALLEEYNAAVANSERVAQELDKQIKARRDTLAALEHALPKRPESDDAPAMRQQREAAIAQGVDQRALDGRKKQVKRMYVEGYRAEDIARELGVPKSEVELIIAMLGM